MKGSIKSEDSRGPSSRARNPSRPAEATEQSSVPQAARLPADPKFDFFFEILPRMCFQVDSAGRLQRVNSMVMATLGHDKHKLLNRPFLDFVRPDDHKRCEESLKQCLSSAGKSVELDFHMLRKDSGALRVRAIGRGLRASGGDSFALLVGEKESDGSDPERELAACRECLRRMTSELTRTEVSERRRVAGELHDLVGGGLVAAQLKLGDLGAAVPRELSRTVDEIRDGLKTVIDSLRVLTFQISNPLLYEVGLGAALEELLRSLAKDQVLNTEVQLGPEPTPLSEDLRTVLYQVLSEVLFDVVKPSRAKTVRLTTRTQGDQLIVELEHDGEGFDASELESRLPDAARLRFLKARHQIAGIGGELTIESTAGRSTKVEISAPVGDEAESSERL